ncbi:MAG TPA: 30S ribosomal protein S4 [Candidatus Azoamicus sp. MARI]
MARFLKPSCKRSRRIGSDLNLKGLGGRDISTKCNLKTFPGQHGSKRKKVSGNYSLQLAAKQMIKYTYGILEKQFRHFYKRISRKKGTKGELFLNLIEKRLDNVVYRMGFALTRAESRQLISHKTIIVLRNGKETNVNIPSFIVKKDDIIKIKESCKSQLRIQYALKCAEKNGFVKWIDTDIKNMSGKFIREPERKELPTEFKEQLVCEFYSR